MQENNQTNNQAEDTAVSTTNLQSASEDSNAPEQKPNLVAGSNKQLLIQYGIAGFIILLMGVGLLYALEQQGRVETGVFDKVSELVNPTPAVAIVNGTEIKMTDYQKNFDNIKNSAVAQGADVTDEAILKEIKDQAVEVLVNTEILKQAAGEAGVVVTDEDINARYAEIVEMLGGEEALVAKMAELSIDKPSLMQDIAGELLIQGYLKKSVDTSAVVVTAEDLNSAYAEISKGNPGQVPPLAEIKEQLSEQLRTTKEQELVNAHITKLRSEAAVEILI